MINHILTYQLRCIKVLVYFEGTNKQITGVNRHKQGIINTATPPLCLLFTSALRFSQLYCPLFFSPLKRALLLWSSYCCPLLLL